MKENICCYHNDIKMYATRIKKTTNIDEINQCATEIIELAKKAKVAGQHMENRLYQYHDAMIGLGFVRNKRKKYERK
jgi:Na+/phosphate symporter